MSNSTIEESPSQPKKWFRGQGLLVWPIFLFVALLAGALPLFAQTGAGSLRIRVEDASGAVVPGASVQVIDTATNASRSQSSNNDGYAVFAPLERGTYNVQVTQAGFSTLKIGMVTIDVNQNREVVAPLQVATAASTVEVQAAAVSLQTESSSEGAVVTGNEITNLPLAERHYTDLTLLAPGATTSTNAVSIRGPDWFVVNGTRSTMNNYLLDGMDNNNNTHNDQSRSAEVIAPSPDALTEFQILTDNPSAQYGRAAGAVVIASIKSGTNAIHGAVWEFNRNTALAANSWTSNHIHAGKDQLTWNQPGFSIGGPIIKNKLFYFGDFEYLGSTAYSSLLASVPTQDMIKGNFSALKFPVVNPATGIAYGGNIIPAAQIDPLGQKVLNLYPAPNLPGTVNSGGQPSNNYGRSVPLTDSLKKTDIRIDYNKSDRHRFFARYGMNQDNYVQANVLPGLADSGAQFGGTDYARNQSGAAGWTFLISPTLVNVVRFQYNNTSSAFINATAGMESGTAFGFIGLPPTLDSVGSLPRFVPTNYSSLGTGNYRPQFSNPWQYQINDNLSITKGAHTVQIGFDYRLKQDNFVDLSNRTVGYTFSGNYTGDASADMLLGMPQTVTGETFLFAHQRQKIAAVYIQDDWKVRRNLTVNLGFRYDYFTPTYGVGAAPNVNFDFTNNQLVVGPGGALVYGARPSYNQYVQDPDRANFGPKLGLAWQLSNKFSFHGAYGIYYDGEDIAGTTPNLIVNAPNVYPITLQRVGNGPAPLILSNPFPSNFLNTSTIPSSSLAFNAFAPYAQVGRIDEWNASLQYLVSPSSTATVSYVGNKSHGMRLSYPANNTAYGSDGSVQANRPFPQFNGVNYQSYLGASRYNALQAKFERRITQGLSTLLAYTYASAIDNTDDFGASNSVGVEVVQQVPFAAPSPVLSGPYGVWGPATEVSRHRLTDAIVWALPVGRGRRFGGGMSRGLDYVIGGWSASSIITRQTGLPFSVTLAASGVNPANNQSYKYFTNEGGANLRPNCAVNNQVTGQSPDVAGSTWLNLAAYSVPALNTPGICARNSALGPALVNWDQSFLKRVALWRDYSLEFHGDLFNILNHPNFAVPATTYGAAGFGVITTTVNNPRQVQLAVKFLF